MCAAREPLLAIIEPNDVVALGWEALRGDELEHVGGRDIDGSCRRRRRILSGRIRPPGRSSGGIVRQRSGGSHRVRVAESDFDPLLSEPAAGEMWCERRHVSLSVRVPGVPIAFGGITQDHQHIDASWSHCPRERTPTSSARSVDRDFRHADRTRCYQQGTQPH